MKLEQQVQESAKLKDENARNQGMLANVLSNLAKMQISSADIAKLVADVDLIQKLPVIEGMKCNASQK